MPDSSVTQPPTLAEETERLRKWRELRRQAAADSSTDRKRQADVDRKTRLDLFETDKANRIRSAEERRKADTEAIESRRRDKARAHLDALDDIETARASLMAAQRRTRRVAALLVAIFIGLPTALTALVSIMLLPPAYHATSTFAVGGTSPFLSRNPMFNTLPNGPSESMALAYQLRAQLEAIVPQDFEMRLDTTQGLVFLTTKDPSAKAAQTLNAEIIQNARKIAEVKILAPAEMPTTPQNQVIANTTLTFFISLSVFSIITIFAQSIRHYARA